MNPYALLLGLALFLGWQLWTNEAHKRGWIRSAVLSPAPLFLLVGILGAKALAAVGEWERYGHTLFTWSGPLAVQGAMIAGAAAMLAWGRLRDLPPLELLDSFTRAFAAMLVPIRAGCFAAGCCFGTPTTLPWATIGSGGVARHPTQLYELVLALALVVLLHASRGLRARPGLTTCSFLLVYGTGRALLELLRQDTEPLAGGVTYPQLVAIGMALAGAWLASALRVRIRVSALEGAG